MPLVLSGKTEGHEGPRGEGGQDLWSVLQLPPREKVAKLLLTRVAWVQTQWHFHGDTGMQAGGVASAQCPLGESAVTCQGAADHRTAHRAKSASSDRSGFFRFEVFEAGAGASVGGEGRSGTVSAALALSSRNLSNSSLVTPSSRSSPFRSVLSHTSMSSMTEGCATGIYEGRGGKQRGQAAPTQPGEGRQNTRTK